MIAVVNEDPFDVEIPDIQICTTGSSINCRDLMLGNYLLFKNDIFDILLPV